MVGMTNTCIINAGAFYFVHQWVSAVFYLGVFYDWGCILIKEILYMLFVKCLILIQILRCAVFK